MADKRELILARLPIVCEAIEGIVAVARNKLDVPQLKRPAIIIQDGSQQRLLAPKTDRFSAHQLMELSPQIWVYVRAGAGDAGPLMTLYHNRIAKAVIADPTLRQLVGQRGSIRYEGQSVPEPTPESKEPRMDVNVVFTYLLRMEDLPT